MRPIRSKMTKKETGVKLAKRIRDYYLGNTMDQVIGIDEAGYVDYWYQVHGSENCALVFFDTQKDCDSDIIEGDHADPDSWTDDTIAGLGELLTGDWAPVDEDGFKIEISYEKFEDEVSI